MSCPACSMLISCAIRMQTMEGAELLQSYDLVRVHVNWSHLFLYCQKIKFDAAIASVPEWSKGLALRSNIGNDARVQTSPLAFTFCSESARICRFKKPCSFCRSSGLSASAQASNE